MPKSSRRGDISLDCCGAFSIGVNVKESVNTPKNIKQCKHHHYIINQTQTKMYSIWILLYNSEETERLIELKLK